MVALTKNQQQALLRKWKQSDQGMSYRTFRRTVEPMVCDPAVLLSGVVCGYASNLMVVLIHRRSDNGYSLQTLW